MGTYIKMYKGVLWKLTNTVVMIKLYNLHFQAFLIKIWNLKNQQTTTSIFYANRLQGRCSLLSKLLQ